MFDDLVWVGGCTSSVDEVEAMQYVVRIFKRESHLLCLRTDATCPVIRVVTRRHP